MSAKVTKKSRTKAKSPAKPATLSVPKAESAAVDLARAFRETYSTVPPVVSNTIVLDPDIAPHFQNSRAVNEALRALLRIVKQVRA